MPLIVQWSGGELLLNESETAVVGRSDSVDITIKHPKMSRHHLLLYFEEGKWKAKDLDTPNGTYRSKERITEVELWDADSLFLGSTIGPELKVGLLSTSRPAGLTRTNQGASRAEKKIKKRHNLSSRFRVGRDEANDLVLDDFEVSRFHSEVNTKDGQNHEIVDLGSANGTFVNGSRIKRHKLVIGDFVSVGAATFVYNGGALEDVSSGIGP